MSLITINIHQHVDTAEIVQRLDQLDVSVQSLRTELGTNMTQITDALDALTQKVTDEETVEASLVTLVSGIKSALDTALANSDPTAALAAVQAISDKIGADTQTMADAVAANTTTP